MAWVYILSTSNNRYYIGSTNDLDRRISEHSVGKSRYTSEVLPVQLRFSQEYLTLGEAREIEKWIKKQKSKTLIDNIIMSGIITHRPPKGAVAKLVIASPCHGEDHGFESRQPRNNKNTISR